MNPGVPGEGSSKSGWQAVTTIFLVIFSLLVGVTVFNIVLYLGNSPSTSFTSEQEDTIIAVVEADDDIEELRKKTEDLALEQLRLELRADMRNPVKAPVDESAEEEDEEMSTIFEIVRLAQERFSTEERLTQTQVNLTYINENGVILPTLSGATCVLSEDCARTCDEECEGLAARQHCSKDCKDLCTTSCQGRKAGDQAECKTTCMSGCQTTCLASKGDLLMRRRDACQEKVRKACRLECEVSPISTATRRASESICYTRCSAANLTACNTEMNPECLEQCGRHLCVEGQCRCPIYARGDPSCSRPLDIAAHLPARYADCAATMSNPKFNTKAELKKTGPNATRTFLDLTHQATKDQAAKDLSNAHGAKKRSGYLDLDVLADFSTCAVVGSSNSMIGKNLGAEIDEHTAVIRFNDAPTQDFEQHVGNRTTLRVQNVMTCGWHESNSEMCLHYTGWAGNTCEREKLDWWKDCRFLRFSDRMLTYVRTVFRDPRASFSNDKLLMAGLSRGRHKEVNRDTSAGFFGLSLALHLCGKVDIYGFSQGSGHYFRKIDRSRGQRKFAAKHPWALEKQCVSVVSSLHGVSKVN